jgi:hypothetical protein
VLVKRKRESIAADRIRSAMGTSTAVGFKTFERIRYN